MHMAQESIVCLYSLFREYLNSLMHMTLPLVHATLKLLIYNFLPYNTSTFEI